MHENNTYFERRADSRGAGSNPHSGEDGADPCGVGGLDRQTCEGEARSTRRVKPLSKTCSAQTVQKINANDSGRHLNLD